ncbi:DUF5593 domain-containing protein [Gordonia polyisoprenivorans]|nr:GAF domain-containing protein [Gordonia polyisoprenivorans]WCB40270.1 DUF5593 domain-containing protein [Gordonia polyisoprenivorans]
MPAVLLIGARSKKWRPLSNEFRGSVHKTVLRLVETVLNNLKQSQVLIDLAGPRLALASPVLGPSRQVHGVLMWIGDPDQTPPAQPVTQAWEWDLADRVAPTAVTGPRIPQMSADTLTDRLSRLLRPADAVRIAMDIRGLDRLPGFRGMDRPTRRSPPIHPSLYRHVRRPADARHLSRTARASARKRS